MDFCQGKITTIHDFNIDPYKIKERLKILGEKYPIGVVIPIAGKDLNDNSLKKIIEELNKCDYLKKIFIAISATNEEYEKSLRIFKNLELPCEIIWCNKKEMNKVLEELKKKGLDITYLKGKGKDLWIATGIASLDMYAIAIHDADIITYEETLPTKLLYPVVESKLDFFFSKGYYARLNMEDRTMHGRVYRLLIVPLIEALQEKLSHGSEFLRYLESFRYLLSGEIAITTDLALNLRMPCDWGLEIGTLAEIFRNVTYRRICQVDLGFYEHKHKEMIKNGLLKTAEDCIITLLRTLTETDGIEVSKDFLLSLQVMYRKFAQNKIRQYQADAICNNLKYNIHLEEATVEQFSQIIMDGGKKYLKNPVASQMPDWIRAISAMPDLREKLKDSAVKEINQK
ncbi:MAG: glucosyl-3-phosphoglycerate synthase [Thermoplasmatales archaeon]|nr:glucosyl-3-phosphoglycerate synthase [Thermoplasmatales archaeon]